MAQSLDAQPQSSMKFGLDQEDRKSLIYRYGTGFTYFEKMPTELSHLVVESMIGIEHFKSSIPKKYLVLALYTKSLVLKDEFKQILYEKLLNVFSVTKEEKFFAIECISLFSTISIFERMTLVLASKDFYEHNINNMLEFQKLMEFKDNHYDYTAMNRTTSLDYGMSAENEESCILQFGAIPQFFNLIPRKFADNLFRKWLILCRIDIPLKIRFLIISVIFATSSIKSAFDKLSLMQFIKKSMILGLTEQELIDVSTILAFSSETNVWIRSSYYSIEQFAKEVDDAIFVMEYTHNVNINA